MSKIVKVFLVLLFLAFFIPTTFANHPICDSSNATSSNLIKEVSNQEQCPQDACYTDSGIDGPFRFACYKIVSQSNQQQPPSQIPPPANQLPQNQSGVSCYVEPTSISIKDTFTFNASGLDPNELYKITINNIPPPNFNLARISPDNSGMIQIVIDPKSYSLGLTHGIIILRKLGTVVGTPVCYTEINITETIGDLPKDTKFYRCNPSKGVCEESTEVQATTDKAACDQECASISKRKACKDPDDPAFDPDKNIVCVKAGGLPCDPDKPSIKTAIGCIHTNPGDLIQDVLKFGLGIAGGLAFLMMILGAFQMLTSAGNPDTLQAGRERLTSAVIGLLIIIFAVLLLQIIGFDILGLPDFGR